jgi:putative transcriptional regulator
MSAKSTKSQNEHRKGKTDWKKIKNMSERQVLKAAKSDLDAPPLSLVELKQFKRVHPAKMIDIKRVRARLHLSQEKFAKYFGVNIRTLQEWEQGRRMPTTIARNFLIVIAREPEAVQRALSS